MITTAVIVLVAAAPVAQEAPVSQSEQTPEKPAITLQLAAAPRMKVHYLSIPWGPNTFAAMERPGDGFYNRRSWPFARMETEAPLTLEGTTIPPGNYALVFHPNTTDNLGMSLEVRRLNVTEFLEPGNVMTPTPAGETIWRAPIRFDTAEGTSPALKIELRPEKDALLLRVSYGNRWMAREFRYR